MGDGVELSDCDALAETLAVNVGDAEFDGAADTLDVKVAVRLAV